MALNTSIAVAGKIPSRPTKQENASKFTKVFGIKYPMGSSVNRGFFTKVSGKELLRDNLTQLIRTERGERVMLPHYGMNLRRYLFEPLDELTFSNIRSEIVYSINSYEPRVEILKLRVSSLDEYGADGLQAINITLTLRIKEEVNSLFEVAVDIK